MRDPDVRQLGQDLMQAGVAPGNVQRMLLEIRDHVDDLRDEAIACGASPRDAHAEALERIGDPYALTHAVAKNANLQTWMTRHSQLGRLCLPLACYLFLSSDDALVTDGSNASLIVRWGAALTLSAAVTGAMLLIMQLSIAFG